MYTLPPINKVFSLVSQEEHQIKVGTSMISDGINHAAFAVKMDSTKNMDSNSGLSTQFSLW